LNQTIRVNKKTINVSFSNYFDSVYGEFLFQRVMCDVFMPGNEVVPVEVEKEQIKRVIEGFKKRSELYREIRQENVKGKMCYVITPGMRYDLEWLKGKPPKPKLTKEGPSRKEEAAEEAAEPAVETALQPKRPERRQFADSRRKFLTASGFVLNEDTNNWQMNGIRYPDAKIDAAASDEEFIRHMNALVQADDRSRSKWKSRNK